MLRYAHHLEKISKNPDENKIIFIDRDGVINVDFIGDYVKRWEDFKFEEGALEALHLLASRGYQIIIISNQAGVGDGIFPETALRDVHEKMIQVMEKQGIPIRSAHYCLHGKEEGCHCRKPETGLFEDAVHGIPINKKTTYFIGDKKSDIVAGKRFGIKTIFVRTGHGQFDEKKLGLDYQPDLKADNLLDAVKKIL